MKDLLIGIDAGTSVIKSIAFDLSGRQIAVHAVPNSYETTPDAGAMQDMDRTWTDTVATLVGLAEKIPDLANRTAAISVTAQGDGTWLIDKAGRPVGGGWLWLDARAAAIVDDFRTRPEDRRRYELTGTGLVACQQGPQLLWMKDNQPELVENAAHAFHCKDWLYYRMTGEIATDPTEGLYSFGEIGTRAYCDEVIGILGLEGERRLMPQIIDGTEYHSALSKEAAEATGMLAGTPVVLSFLDVICTALGAGLYDRSSPSGVTIVGSTGMHMRLAPTADDVTLNDDKTGYTMNMPVRGVYAQMQSNMASTLNIDWMLSMIGSVLEARGGAAEKADLIAELDRWIESAAPGQLIYQPYISDAGERGPFVDANARAGFIGLSSRHDFRDMLRAVVEGLAFASKDCYAAMGETPAEIRLSGGAARSRALRKILGSALGRPVRTSAREEAGAAGAAMMAAVSIGLYDTMDACVEEWVTPLLGATEAPDAELTETYDALYPAYAAAHAALRPVWKMMRDRNGAGA